MKTPIFLISLFLLSGCATVEKLNDKGKDYKNQFVSYLHKHLPDENQEVAAAEPPKVYCYKTFAKPDCYSQPIEGQEDRLVK
jgi:hypothetical protein